MSPSDATMTFFIGTLGNTSCSTAAKFSTMKITFAPESLSWCSSSRGL
jgi:hypothetical protein